MVPHLTQSLSLFVNAISHINCHNLFILFWLGFTKEKCVNHDCSFYAFDKQKINSKSWALQNYCDSHTHSPTHRHTHTRGTIHVLKGGKAQRRADKDRLEAPAAPRHWKSTASLLLRLFFLHCAFFLFPPFLLYIFFFPPFVFPPCATGPAHLHTWPNVRWLSPPLHLSSGRTTTSMKQMHGKPIKEKKRAWIMNSVFPKQTS